MFIRNLRRELSSITAAFSDGSGSGGMEPQGLGRGAGGRSFGGSRGREDSSLSIDHIGAGLVAIASSSGNSEKGG